MSHKFRGKNSLGALVLNEHNYYFDPEIVEIIRSEDKKALLENYNKIFDDSMNELRRLRSENK